MTRKQDSSNDSAAMKQALREALEHDGQLDAIKAQIRAKVFLAIEGARDESDETRAMTKPKPAPETMLVHELIRDYLAFAGLNNTLAVLEAEASLPKAVLPRSVLSTEMGLPGASQAVPVMYSLVAEGFAQKSANRGY
jgi:lisH domain-containing protein FOPNL